MHLFITCPPFLEQLLTDELKTYGISARRWPRGVSAPLSMENVYKINYLSRFATRVLWPLAHFPCTSREALYAEARKIPWHDYLTLDKTFAIDANVTNSPSFRSSHFAGLVVKDAICDAFREKTGQRPTVEVYNPAVQFHLFIFENKATLSFDTSGAPLFKRGYRQGNVEAPLQETLAAAILKLAGYSPSDILCDPLCGSGTFLFEAALMGTSTPPAFFRTQFGFFHHRDFAEKEWQAVKTKCDASITPLQPSTLFGSDRDRLGIDLCQKTAQKTGFPVLVKQTHLHTYQPPVQPTLVITNPPYGHRLSSDADLYTNLSKFLEVACQNRARAAILSSHKRLPPTFVQSTQKPIALLNGGLEVFLHLTRYTTIG